MAEDFNFVYFDNGFQYFNPVRVFFGPGMIDILGRIQLPGKKAFVATYPTTGYNTVKILEQLKKNNCGYYLYDKVTANPVSKDIDAAAEIAKAEGCDFCLSIGGGSATDTCKGIAVLLKNPGKIWDYVGSINPDGSRTTERETEVAAPVVVVSTTAGTGTEVNQSAAIVNSETLVKSSLDKDYIFSTLTIVDPELQVTIPKHFTASQGMDQIFHVVEGILTTGCEANRLAELYGKEALRIVSKALPLAYDEPENLDARTDVAYACMLSGYVETLVFLKSLHGIGLAFNSFAPTIPHGLAMCIISIECMKKYVAEQPERCAMLSEWVGYGNRPEGILEFIVDMQKKVNLYNIDYRQYGLAPEHAEEYAAMAVNAGNGLFDYDVNRLNVEETTKIILEGFARCDGKI